MSEFGFCAHGVSYQDPCLECKNWKCDVPPRGWTCTRKPGHEGPCAAYASSPDTMVTEYLATGGLFNPEMADHNQVRDLLMDCRAEIGSLRALLREVATSGVESNLRKYVTVQIATELWEDLKEFK